MLQTGEMELFLPTFSLKKGGITKSSQLYKPNYCIQHWTSNIRGQPNVK